MTTELTAEPATALAAVPVDRSGCPRPASKLHGTWRAYAAGCRCSDAREDRRLRDQRLRVSPTAPTIWVNATGTIRKIRALQTMSWGIGDIGRRLGVTGQRVSDIAANRSFVMRRTADAMDGVYRELVGLTGTNEQVFRLARSRGYAPPWAWHKLDIDDPATVPWFFGWDTDGQVVEALVKRCAGQYEPLPARITLDDVALAVHRVIVGFREPAAALERGFDVTRDAAFKYVKAGGLSELQLRRLQGKVRMSSAERARLAS